MSFDLEPLFLLVHFFDFSYTFVIFGKYDVLILFKKIFIKIKSASRSRSTSGQVSWCCHRRFEHMLGNRVLTSAAGLGEPGAKLPNTRPLAVRVLVVMM